MNRVKSSGARLVAGVALLLVAGVSGWLAGPAEACTTPVYRYAMYNWPPAPYHVYFFHHGELDETDKALSKKLNELAEKESAMTNVWVREVDISDPKRLESMPKVLKEAYEKHADGDKPVHLVFTPWGVNLFAGRLDEATIRAMVDSSARQKLAKLFEKTHSAILLVLTGPDPKDNGRAEKACQDVLAAAKRGEIMTADDYFNQVDNFGGPPPGPEQAPESAGEATDKPAAEGKKDEQAKKEEKKSSSIKLAVLKVARDDPAEKWLVDMLLSVEPDLRDKEFADKAMVFAVYGRGRAMPPYIGKGVTKDNLIECIEFLGGACSCMVKDQNPGSDLLMGCDWDAVAEAMYKAEEPDAQELFGYEEYETPQAEQPQKPEESEQPEQE